MVSFPRGISVSVSFEQASLGIDTYGFVGTFTQGDQLTLSVDIPNEVGVHAFYVDGHNNVVPKSNLLRHTHGAIMKSYASKIRMCDDLDFSARAPFPMNVIHLAEIASDWGKIQLYELSIICQKGRCFVVCQKTHSASCYLDHSGQKRYPALSLFCSNTEKYVSSLIPESVHPVSIEMFSQEKRVVPFLLESNYGFVLRFNKALGAGMLFTNSGKVRVSWKDVPLHSQGSYAYLDEGEIVSFEHVGSSVIPAGSKSLKGDRQAFGINRLGVAG